MMNVARMEFVTLIHLTLEPRLAELLYQAQEQGIQASLYGVAGSACPSLCFGVEGIGEVGYFWKQGEVYRQWRPTPQEPWEVRTSNLAEAGAMLAEATAMVAEAVLRQLGEK